MTHICKNNIRPYLNGQALDAADSIDFEMFIQHAPVFFHTSPHYVFDEYLSRLRENSTLMQTCIRRWDKKYYHVLLTSPLRVEVFQYARLDYHRLIEWIYHEPYLLLDRLMHGKEYYTLLNSLKDHDICKQLQQQYSPHLYYLASLIVRFMDYEPPYPLKKQDIGDYTDLIYMYHLTYDKYVRLHENAPDDATRHHIDTMTLRAMRMHQGTEKNDFTRIRMYMMEKNPSYRMIGHIATTNAEFAKILDDNMITTIPNDDLLLW